MATALVSEFDIIGHDSLGNPTMHYLVHLMVPEATDPAKRFQILHVNVQLDSGAPAQFVQQSRNAIIAAAAALVPAVALNPADVIQGMYS